MSKKKRKNINYRTKQEGGLQSFEESYKYLLDDLCVKVSSVGCIEFAVYQFDSQTYSFRRLRARQSIGYAKWMHSRLRLSNGTCLGAGDVTAKEKCSLSHRGFRFDLQSIANDLIDGSNDCEGMPILRAMRVKWGQYVSFFSPDSLPERKAGATPFIAHLTAHQTSRLIIVVGRLAPGKRLASLKPCDVAIDNFSKLVALRFQQRRAEETEAQIRRVESSRASQIEQSRNADANLPLAQKVDACWDASQKFIKKLADWMLTDLKAQRCEILTRSPDEPQRQWHRIASPESDFQSQIAIPSKGLTWMTLGCAPNEHVLTDSLEDDPNWSRRYGGPSYRDASEGNDTESLQAWISLPIYAPSPLFDASQSPSGTLMVVRNYSGGVGPFTSQEVYFLSQVTNLIGEQLAYYFGIVATFRERSWFGAVSRLRHRHEDEPGFYGELARLIREVVPGTNILLSVVDSCKTEIRGKAVVGRATENLIKETIRPIVSEGIFETSECAKEAGQLSGKSIDASEDSLSFALRTIRLPTIVDPSDVRDSLAARLQQDTEVRYQFQKNLHLFIPFLNERGDTVAIAIAVKDGDQTWPKEQVDLNRLEYFARFIGTAVSDRESHVEDLRRARVSLRARRSLMPAILDLWDAQDSLREIISSLCQTYGFECSVAYAFDPRHGILRGVAGYRVNEGQVRQTMYVTDHCSGADKAPRRSLALEVFESGKSVQVSRMDVPPVDNEDRKLIEIDGVLCGIGIPLKYNSLVQGVVVLCYRNECNPKHPSPRLQREFVNWLERMFEYGGLAITVSSFMLSKNRDTRARMAQTTIMQQIESLLKDPRSVVDVGSTGEIPVADSNQKEFEGVHDFAEAFENEFFTIVQDAAQVFGAQVAGLFLSDHPLILPNDQGDFASRCARTEFKLVAGVGYINDAYADKGLIYTQTEDGLTPSALALGRHDVTRDVLQDGRWSGKALQFLTEEFRERELRTWMGLPLVVTDGNRRYLFGILTFTRFRRFERDRMWFTDQDIATARSIAALLAVVLQQREKFVQVRRVTNGLLRTFRHEDVGELFGHVIDTLRDAASALSSDQAGNRLPKKHVDAALVFTELLSSVFEAFESFVNEDSAWGAVQYSVEKITRSIRRATSKSPQIGNGIKWCYRFEGKSCDPEHIITQTDIAKVRSILYALIRNAIKSCRERIETEKSQGSGGYHPNIKVEIYCDATVLNLRVSDNGMGINETERERIFVEGVSLSGGTGLGLAMVEKFVETATGSIRFTSSKLDHTIFEIAIPAINTLTIG